MYMNRQIPFQVKNRHQADSPTTKSVHKAPSRISRVPTSTSVSLMITVQALQQHITNNLQYNLTTTTTMPQSNVHRVVTVCAVTTQSEDQEHLHIPPSLLLTLFSCSLPAFFLRQRRTETQRERQRGRVRERESERARESDVEAKRERERGRERKKVCMLSPIRQFVSQNPPLHTQVEGVGPGLKAPRQLRQTLIHRHTWADTHTHTHTPTHPHTLTLHWDGCGTIFGVFRSFYFEVLKVE